MAVSIEARQGVYALLLGSGISRPAGIPTAWEMVRDLIRQVAASSGEDTAADPVDWYRNRFGKEPSYSELLEELAPTPGDRSHVLRPYFEPTERDREEGSKTPTDAHRAIARTIRERYFKVVITTNFDRLLEHALANEGLSPQIVSNDATVQGMAPPQHSDCTIIKVHGDYVDLATKNTLGELTEYSPDMNRLLDRIFTEYGLVICGWSGEWDKALANAILRSTRHRFATYWLTRSGASTPAQSIIDFRQATVVPIESADEAFATLESSLRSLRDLQTEPPVSSEIAMATAKRYLASTEYSIRLHDLVMQEADAIRVALAGPSFDVSSPPPDESNLPVRHEHAYAVTTRLCAVLLVGGYFGHGEHIPIWQEALRRASSVNRGASGVSYPAWTSLRTLPASLALYSVGMGALAAGRYGTIKALLLDTFSQDPPDNGPLIEHTYGFGSVHPTASNALFGSQRKTPGSDWIHDHLQERLASFVGGTRRYEALFNRLELLLSMAYTELVDRNMIDNPGWTPAGRFTWNDRRSERDTFQIFRNELSRTGGEWAPVAAGMFRQDPDYAGEVLEKVADIWKEHRW